MNNRIKVDSVSMEQKQLILLSNLETGLEVFPQNRMLADSEGNSFIYIIEVQGEYKYLQLNEPLWDKMKVALDKNLICFLQCTDSSKIELDHFNEELKDLLHNIKDNANYGEAFVKKVEEYFYI